MLFISLANSIGYTKKKETGDLPSMNTRRSYEEQYGGFMSLVRHCQVWKDDDVVPTQVGSDSAVVPTIEVFEPEPSATVVTASLVSSYIDATTPANSRWYFEFDIDFSDFTDKEIQVQVTQGAYVFLSEYLTGRDINDDLAKGYLMRLDWSNAAQPSAYTNYQIDYNTGIQHFIYVDAVLRKYVPKGSDEVFDQITIKILIEAILERALVFETKAIPKFLSEKITMAGKHFYFLINNDQYLTDKIPDVKTNNTNFGVLTWTVIDRTVLGYNSDNIGIEGNSMEWTKVRSNALITTTWSFTIPFSPDHYELHVLYAKHGVGSGADYQIKVGTTLGGSELITYAMGNVTLVKYPAAGTKYKPFTLNKLYNVLQTIYVEIQTVGGKADVEALLIYKP